MGFREVKGTYMRPSPTMKGIDGKQLTDLIPSISTPPPADSLGYDKVTSYEKYLK